jgi:hypothetical protein
MPRQQILQNAQYIRGDTGRTWLGVVFCDECSRRIRWWQRRLTVGDSRRVHSVCWEGRKFFKLLIAETVVRDRRRIIPRRPRRVIELTSVIEHD